MNNSNNAMPPRITNNASRDKGMPLDLLSKYKSLLMGIAIIFIMLCHNSVIVPQVIVTANSAFKSLMQCGVDIFFLLSGLGCFFSLAKTPDTLLFYRKRIKRILPSFILCMCLCGIPFLYFGKYTFSAYLRNISMISFFTDAVLYIWFIPAILTLYLFVPIVFHFTEKNIHDGILVIISLLILFGSITASFFLSENQTIFIVNEIFIIRIPIFLIGFYFGKKIYRKDKTTFSSTLVISSLGISFILIVINILFNSMPNIWIFTRALFLPFSISLSLAISKIASLVLSERSKIYKILCFIGTITLELYLFHERLLVIVQFGIDILNHFGFLVLSPIWNSVLLNIIAIISSIIAAYIVNKIIKYLFGRLQKRKKALT